MPSIYEEGTSQENRQDQSVSIEPVSDSGIAEYAPDNSAPVEKYDTEIMDPTEDALYAAIDSRHEMEAPEA